MTVVDFSAAPLSLWELGDSFAGNRWSVLNLSREVEQGGQSGRLCLFLCMYLCMCVCVYEKKAKGMVLDIASLNDAQ